MKIDKSEMVVRYHVVFSEAETRAMQEIGWLPPYLTKPADMWLTLDEFNEYVELGFLTRASRRRTTGS